ncbi:MAG: AAA-like domain-containing protein [Woeseiaceae bacterium]|nr:AAA-like domain-containing protein [Woeseiaceae bacterium]
MAEDSDKQQKAPRRHELDSGGEYFSVGAPLHAVRAGYIRRSADDVLYETLLGGRYAHVIAPYRSGKSSLVAATAARLENNGFKVAILDLEQIGDREAGGDAGRWYYSVAYRVLRQLRIRVDLQEWWQDKSILSNRQRLLEFYSEIVLQNIPDRVVVFIDEVQCIARQEFGDQLLASIRAAHNARATDPEFGRLSFVLLGECDPLSLIAEPELSPFNVTQPVALEDFTREQLELFATELNLSREAAAKALDRIHYWTSGQPYLTQKLARAVSREDMGSDVADEVDRIVVRQLTGRNALHNEPHLSHIHREVVNDRKRADRLLNLYGRIRKGITVQTDLGSDLQRRLLAIGLLAIDDDGRLVPRNRVYAQVFTARWANENLPNNWRAPAIAAGVLLALLAIPFWYSQVLPGSYVETLTSDTTPLPRAREAWLNFASFPGHTDTATNLYRNFLERRAQAASDLAIVTEAAAHAAELPDAGRLPDHMLAEYWDRQAFAAMREERRDDALIATLESLVVSTPQRRSRAAMLIGADYQQLLASLPAGDYGAMVFNPGSVLLTETRDARVSQWSLGPQGLAQREPWTITALEISPLVRRVIVDRQGQVGRVGLTLTLSHARVGDLRIKVIAPSGRTAEVVPGVASASANQDIRIPADALRDLVGETVTGTWSLSIRDEALGVAGHLVGWRLQLDSQVVVEDFQRGLNIPDPVERETDNVWFSGDGRFSVARAMQSDSARIWDLAFAKPVRAIAVSEVERLIGLGEGARMLVTATQDTVNLWDTATGARVAQLPAGTADAGGRLTADGTRLLTRRRGDTDTHLTLYSLADAAVVGELTIAGSPALVALDDRAARIAVADFDRAVRIWDFASGELLTQVAFAAQPSELSLAPGGDAIGVVFGESGAGLWRVDEPAEPLVLESGAGRWQLAFSPSGTRAILGRGGYGFQTFAVADGRRLGAALGSGSPRNRPSPLAFSADEQVVVTGGAASEARFWRAPAMPAPAEPPRMNPADPLWPPAGDSAVAATPDARLIVIGDRQGDVHMLPATGAPQALSAEAEGVSYLGHGHPVTLIEISPGGEKVASAAADNSVRIWQADTGLPAPFFIQVPGNPVERMAFSPDGSRLALLSANRAHLVDTLSGEIEARFELGEPHRGIAFVEHDRLFIGNESGALVAVTLEPGGNWTVATVWRGATAIRHLAASPLANYLVLADQNNRVQQFSLVEGRPGTAALDLPATIEEIRFAPGGSRLLIRTGRWVHRASSSASGLVWLDAILAPPVLSSANLVFGAGHGGAALANRVHVVVAAADSVRLEALYFSGRPGPGLFGSREELLAEWLLKTGRGVPAGPDVSADLRAGF